MQHTSELFRIQGVNYGGLKDKNFTQIIGKAGNAHFPNITKLNRAIIVNSALRRAKLNYYDKYRT